MSIQLVIELKQREGAQTVLSALEAYKSRLQNSIERTQRRLSQFEQKYGVTTPYFLENMTAEDLQDGDMEYVEWAGEAKLMVGLQTELTELEDVRYHFH